MNWDGLIRVALPVAVFLFYLFGHLMNREADPIPPRRPTPYPPDGPRGPESPDRFRRLPEPQERQAPVRWGPQPTPQTVQVERRRVGGEEILVLSTTNAPSPPPRQTQAARPPQKRQKGRGKQASAKPETRSGQLDSGNLIGGQLVIEPLVTGALLTATSKEAVVTSIERVGPPIAERIREDFRDVEAIRKAILINEILLPPVCARPRMGPPPPIPNRSAPTA